MGTDGACGLLFCAAKRSGAFPPNMPAGLRARVSRIANLISRAAWALTPLLQRGLMFTQVKLFLLLRTHWPFESYGFV
jgi:hypothetical protein